jgi:hypothetical protein
MTIRRKVIPLYEAFACCCGIAGGAVFLKLSRAASRS